MTIEFITEEISDIYAAIQKHSTRAGPFQVVTTNGRTYEVRKTLMKDQGYFFCQFCPKKIAGGTEYQITLKNGHFPEPEAVFQDLPYYFDVHKNKFLKSVLENKNYLEVLCHSLPDAGRGP